MTRDWRRTTPSWRVTDQKTWFTRRTAMFVAFALCVTLLQVWQHATVQSLSVEVGKVAADLKHANDRCGWLQMQLDRASSRKALGPMAVSTGLRPLDPSQIVMLPEEFLIPSEARAGGTGSQTLLAFAGRALQSLVPDAAARGRHVN